MKKIALVLIVGLCSASFGLGVSCAAPSECLSEKLETCKQEKGCGQRKACKQDCAVIACQKCASEK